MTMKRTLAAALLAGLSGAATAQVWLPAEGIWQIDGANGSGLTLDVRDDAIGIGLFTYDEDGNGTWYSGAAALVDGTLEAELTRFARAGETTTAVDTLPLTLQFQASATGTLSIGDGQARPVRHFAFGADYVGGLTLAGVAGDVAVVPDLRGRWVFTPTQAEGFASQDLVFEGVKRTDDSVAFTTTADPDAVIDDGEFSFVCSTDAVPAGELSHCSLVANFGLSPPAPPPMEIARFDPSDLSVTRLAGEADTMIGFRVPRTINAPQSGIWQIAGRFGEGVTLDVRPDLVAVGVYGYDEQGNATWSLATGPIVADAVEADLVTFSGGSCVDCEHNDPVVGATRPMRLEFVGATRARLTIGDAEPLALSLLPFGADYLDKPFAGDPGAEEFGTHALPALSGAWVQTRVFEEFIEQIPLHPAAAYVLGEAETVSLDGETYNALVALPQEAWGPPHPFGGSYASSLACEAAPGDDIASCDLINTGGGGSPPAPPRTIASIRPWDIGATRISGFNVVGGETPGAVYLFRIPPRPVVNPAR